MCELDIWFFYVAQLQLKDYQLNQSYLEKKHLTFLLCAYEGRQLLSQRGYRR